MIEQQEFISFLFWLRPILILKDNIELKYKWQLTELGILSVLKEPTEEINTRVNLRLRMQEDKSWPRWIDEYSLHSMSDCFSGDCCTTSVRHCCDDKEKTHVYTIFHYCRSFRNYYCIILLSPLYYLSRKEWDAWWRLSRVTIRSNLILGANK